MEHRAWVGRWRDELKGLAILWIVYYHSQLDLPGGWNLLHQWGYGGVDIFFFLMGMGLYHSLQKNNDLRGYTSRRLWRILPAYLPVLILWMAFMYPSYGLSTVQAIRGIAGNLTMTGYWLQTPRVFNWFANGQFFFLLIAPLCFALLTRSDKPTVTLIALLILSGLIGFACFGQKQLMGASRLPVFLLGMAFGMDWPVNGKRGLVRTGYLMAFFAGLAILLLATLRYTWTLLDYGMYWYPFALITPPLCVGIAGLFQKSDQTKRLFTPLRKLGESSFEIYLINIWMVELARKTGVTDPWAWILLCALNLFAGMGYHVVVIQGVAWLRKGTGTKHT